jgi:hypothetical protein
VPVLSETCILQALNAWSWPYTHVATKLCWNVSSVFKGIQVELGANVDDPDTLL